MEAAAVYIHVCAAAAGCDFMRGAAVGGMRCAFVWMFTSEGEPLAAAIDCICTIVDGFTVLWCITSLQGRHFAWSNQSSRVDVDGSPQAPVQQAAAAFNPALGALEGYQGVREKGGCRDEVACLDGRTLVCRVPGDLAVQHHHEWASSRRSELGAKSVVLSHVQPWWVLASQENLLSLWPASTSTGRCAHHSRSYDAKEKKGFFARNSSWACNRQRALAAAPGHVCLPTRPLLGVLLPLAPCLLVRSPCLRGTPTGCWLGFANWGSTLKSLRRLRPSYSLRKATLSCKVLSRGWKSGSMTNFGCYKRSLISKMPRRKMMRLLKLWTRTFRLADPLLQRRKLGRIPRNFRRWMKMMMTWRAWNRALRDKEVLLGVWSSPVTWCCPRCPRSVNELRSIVEAAQRSLAERVYAMAGRLDPGHNQIAR